MNPCDAPFRTFAEELHTFTHNTPQTRMNTTSTSDFKSDVSTYFTTRAESTYCETKKPRLYQRTGLYTQKIWRRDPESNWTNRICNPGHNRFAIAPNSCFTGVNLTRILLAKKGSNCFPFCLEFGAGKESRTLDLNLGKVALYQLSYSRISSLRL